MNPFNPRNTKKGPEAVIQEAIIGFLKIRGWFVKETHGNIYQYGFPDLYATHAKYGQRWIEVKNPEKYVFTPAQLENFPLFTMNGSGIWILTAANETEYAKLFQPYNWHFYLSVARY